MPTWFSPKQSRGSCLLQSASSAAPLQVWQNSGTCSGKATSSEDESSKNCQSSRLPFPLCAAANVSKKRTLQTWGALTDVRSVWHVLRCLPVCYLFVFARRLLIWMNQIKQSNQISPLQTKERYFSTWLNWSSIMDFTKKEEKKRKRITWNLPAIKTKQIAVTLADVVKVFEYCSLSATRGQHKH